MFYNFKNFIVAILCLGGVVVAFPQTGPNDDYDGDGIINSEDLDDDNDGISDIEECYPANTTLIKAPTVKSEHSQFNSTNTWSEALFGANEPEFGGSEPTLNSVLNSPQTAAFSNDIRYFGAQGRTTGWLSFRTFSASATMAGVVLWNPDFAPAGYATHTDGGIREFKVEIFEWDGVGWNTTGSGDHTFGPFVANIDNAPQVFLFGESVTNVRQIRIDVLNAWEDINTNGVHTQAPTPTTSSTGYNMVLFEVRFLPPAGDCDLDNDGIDNSFDLDSDGDDCPDALEGSGSVSSAELVWDENLDGGDNNMRINLGTTVDAQGNPTTASGQLKGNSQNAGTQSASCSDFNLLTFTRKDLMRHGKYFQRGSERYMTF